MLDYLLRYIRSKSGRKLVLDATVVYSRDLNLRTNYFSVITFRLYALETSHRDTTSEKSGKLEATNLLLYIILTLYMSMLCIDETPVKVGI